MVEAQLNYFDVAVIGIMFLSCLFAFFRGFVREILSLVAWVGSGIITITFFPQLYDVFQPSFTKPFVAAIATTATLYIGSLIGFAIINRYLIRILKSSTGIGFLDNFLGLVFGGLRGAFIISLGYFAISVVVSEKNRPEWLEKAVTRPFAEAGAVYLSKLAPDYLSKFASFEHKTAESAKDAVQKSAEEKLQEQLDKYKESQDKNGAIGENIKIIRGGGEAGKEPSIEEMLKQLNNLNTNNPNR